MYQVITQLGLVFAINYPPVYKRALRWLQVINLDLIQLSPFECVLSYNFYVSLVSHTVLPMVAVVLLLLVRTALMAAGKKEIAGRCVVAAFYIIFFIYPSVSTRIFSTFNCEQFDGSDRWLRVDLKVDCNAPERPAWIVFATVMIVVWPVGVPALFAYFLLYKYRSTIEYQRDSEQLAASTKQAVRHVDQLHKRSNTARLSRSTRRASWEGRFSGMVERLEALKHRRHTPPSHAAPGVTQ